MGKNSSGKRRSKGLPSPFAYDLEGSDIKRERNKARELKSSEWWKRKLAKGICVYCGKKTPAEELTMDHIVPVSRGGTTSKGNVAPACKTCNIKKKQLLPLEWDAYIRSVKVDGSDETNA